MRSKLKPYAFLAPSLAGTAVFVLIPTLDVVRRSFCDAMGKRFTGLENYRQVLENRAFRLAAANTVRFLLRCLPLLVGISLLVSVLIVGAKRSGEVYKTSLLLPMAVPAASIVFLWRLAFCREGIVNQALALFGAEGPDWIQSGRAFPVLVFTYLWKNMGYDMILWISGLLGIPDELYEAAKVDGAGAWARFLHITLPGISQAAALVAVLSLFRSFQVFREAYLIAGDYPHESIYMLQHLFNNWYLSLDIQKMSAASVLLELVFAVPIFCAMAGSRGRENARKRGRGRTDRRRTA